MRVEERDRDSTADPLEPESGPRYHTDMNLPIGAGPRLGGFFFGPRGIRGDPLRGEAAAKWAVLPPELRPGQVPGKNMFAGCIRQ